MVQIDPLYVNFSMPSQQFEKLAAGFMSGQIAIGTEAQKEQLAADKYRAVSASEAPVYVEALLSNGKIYPQKGKIIFFDSTENSQTSSLAIKAEFANPKNTRILMPGQFVRVRLVGAVYKNAVLIPSSAILNTSQGMLAYVVDANDTVVARPVQAQLQDGMYIVTDGLKAGELVVSEGLIKIRSGQQVQVNLKEFKVSREEPAVQAPAPDGRGVAALEEEIQKSEAPDAQAVPDEAQQQAVPAPVPAADAADASAQPASAPAAATAPAGK